MALHKGLLKRGSSLPECEQHFHDHDETWIVLSGQSKAYEIDHSGQRHDHKLEAGDVWLVEVGHEHGSTDGSPDFKVSVFPGTIPAGAHKPGHYYVEKEGYIPSLELKKTAADRYQTGETNKGSQNESSRHQASA